MHTELIAVSKAHNNASKPRAWQKTNRKCKVEGYWLAVACQRAHGTGTGYGYDICTRRGTILLVPRPFLRGIREGAVLRGCARDMRGSAARA